MEKTIDILFKDFLPAIATLLAAFLGAWFAFILENRKKERELEDKNIAAGNRALFVLIRQLNVLLVFQKQAIEPVRNHPGIFIAMEPLLPRTYDSLKFDVDSLSFLLETDYRQVLMEIMIEELSFQETIRAINERSRIHFTQVQPLMEKAGIIEGGEYKNSDFERILGNRLYLHLRRLTDAVVDHVDKTVISLRKMSEELRNVLRKLYPDAKFIQLKENNN